MAIVKAKQLLRQLLIERGLLTPADLERIVFIICTAYVK